MKTTIHFLSAILFFLATTIINAQDKNYRAVNEESTHNYTEKYEKIAQQQLDAYNKRDIDAFLKPYADDVEIYSFPNKLLSKGKETMRKRYKRMFETIPNLHCTLLNRIVEQNVVIDKEKVQLGDRVLLATAIYVIKDDKIKKVYFIQ